MVREMDLSGRWEFRLDPEGTGEASGWARGALDDAMDLPGTVSAAGKSPLRTETSAGYLSDPRLYEGKAWFSRELVLPEAGECRTFLVLERTRTTRVWVNGTFEGRQDSLCATHRHDITALVRPGTNRITIQVDNTDCPVKGGHMTSPDTQTNWNGITGRMALEWVHPVHVSSLRIFCDTAAGRAVARLHLESAVPVPALLQVSDSTGFPVQAIRTTLQPGDCEAALDASLLAPWSEHSPVRYRLQVVLDLPGNDRPEVISEPFGYRSFKAGGTHFAINGRKTFLRGKHDGMVFPHTGYAPTDKSGWLKVMSAARDHGINHYRFHTACPPRAAFEAADELGIYMEPELPFWGTITVPGDEGHDQAAQDYLVKEGFRILDEFGNHPSFVMMSLGNELWGSKERLDSILAGYKARDGRPLYTMGSNNFQFVPDVLPHDDFFCGVRLSRDRLIRGSYAQCDAPLGHIQTNPPDCDHDYDPLIRPPVVAGTADGSEREITIQYGTGTKVVKAASADEFIPSVPVVSHEVGQFFLFPDFDGIRRFTGVLKAGNLEIFRDRLEKAGMAPWQKDFFRASSALAVDCWKAECETALRSRELAGFQLLDIQDFPGQGTALVGILDSLMEPKGVVEASTWRQWCDDQVLLGRFHSFLLAPGEKKQVDVLLSRYRPGTLENLKVTARFHAPALDGRPGCDIRQEITARGPHAQGVCELGSFTIPVPEWDRPGMAQLDLAVPELGLEQHYTFWVFPGVAHDPALAEGETASLEEVLAACAGGKRVVYYPQDLPEGKTIQGAWCTDFWNYPMFKSISEWMKKPVPVGTLGLLVDAGHPALSGFPTRSHSGPEWFRVAEASRPVILDGTGIEPLVWTIDNLERNHRLGTIFEVQVGTGRVLVCASPLPGMADDPAACALRRSLQDWQSGTARGSAGASPVRTRTACLSPEAFTGLFR